MNLAQPGILEAVPLVARYVSFTLAAEALAPAALPESLKRLAEAANGDSVVVGIGPRLVAALGAAGYEDGTENPEGDLAGEAALVHGAGPGLDGSSYVAVQQWVHDFDAFDLLAETDRDHHFGRRLADNFELEDSPTWAHVKRTAQERMAGQDDGIVDAMFRISKPVSGSFLWCPPVARGRLDLRQLGL